MTADRNPDWIVRAWLDLMPDEAPDRTIADVLEAVERTAQVRRPFAGIRRNHSMNRIAIAAAVVVVGTAVLGASWLLAPRQSMGPPAPSGSPTAPPSPRPAASSGAIPEALLTAWEGAPRDIPGLGPAGHTQWRFQGDGLFLNGQGYASDDFPSTIRVDADTMYVTSRNDARCPSADVGEYRWSLSPKSTRLTISLMSDPCGARGIALNGDWYRVACLDPQNACWGGLEAGTYPTNNYGPRLDPDQPGRTVWGGLTYTVPDGWAISSDHTSDIRLLHATDYAIEAQNAGPMQSTPDIEAWIRPAANVQGQGCVTGLLPGVGRTPDALTAWLASLTALKATKPVGVTIDGHPGRMIDVSVAPTWTAKCDESPSSAPTVPLITEGVGLAGPVGADPYQVGLTAPGQLRLIFVDLGGGRTAMVAIYAPDRATFSSFVTEAMPIVESFHFGS